MSISNQSRPFSESVLGSLRSFRRLHVLLAVVLLSVTLWTAYLAATSYGALSPSTWRHHSSQSSHTGVQDGSSSIVIYPSASSSVTPPPAESSLAKSPGDNGAPPPPPSQSTHTGSKKPFEDIAEPIVPEGVKIIALVFFGRKELVKVLDCYLRRNLKKNGGLLDEVIFTVHTKLKPDLQYLDEELLPSEPAYRRWESTGDYPWWVGSWEGVKDPNAIYIKIDDDVVFFEDHTIPAMVKRMIENPHYFAVSANVVNNPALSWVHSHMGVYYPYWPEMEKPTEAPPASWRASELPAYKGDASGPEGFKADGSSPAPFEGHRWLPVPLEEGESMADMSAYPVSSLTYNAFGPSLTNWAAVAQTHYSFLQHLEQEDTWRYKFDVWDYKYDRLSINFFAIRGKDIIDAFPFPQEDDEEYLTQRRPRELKRHVILDGTGLAVHFAFGPQYKAHEYHGIRWTDLLSRYEEYAKEKICGTNQFRNATGKHA